MRDYRNAKAMAHTLRAALAAKSFKITISQSLELIAEAFGVADWNTLSAAIRAEAAAPRNYVGPTPPPTAEGAPGPQFSAELESTLHRALEYANQRKHQYSTLEHLLLALIDDADASAVMKACNVDLGALNGQLGSYVDNDLKKLVIDDGGESKPTAAFQRVVQRAVLEAKGRGRPMLTGANTLVAMFPETQSPAARLLDEQGMSHQDAANFIARGIV
jgi:hypothetical protein